MASVSERAAWSWQVTEALAWPALAPHVGGGYLMRELDQRIDMRRRIDGWWITGAGERHAVAVRCQDGFGSEYETFTIRDTEYGGLSGQPPVWGPRYHIQSYVSGDGKRLLTAAMADTWEVMAYVDLNRGQRGFWRRAPDHRFAVVPWRDLVTARRAVAS